MKNFLNIFSQIQIAYANKTGPEGLQLLARLYWRLILFLGIITILISASLGGMKLFRVLGTFGEQLPQQADLPVTLDAHMLENKIEDFSARKLKFETLQVSTSTAADPSH